MAKNWARLLSLVSLGYCGLFLVSCTPAHADKRQAVFQAILGNYRAMNADTERQDVDGYMTFLAPGYIRIDRNGVPRDLQHQRKSLVSLFALATHFALGKSLHSNLAVKPLEVSTGSVTAERVEQMKMTLVNHTTGGTVPFVSDTVYEDAWVKTGKTWKIKQSKILKNLTLIGGKPFTGKFHS